MLKKDFQLKTTIQIPSLSDRLLGELSNYLHEHLGLNFSNKNMQDLERCCVNLALAKNISDLPQYLTGLLSSPPSRKVVREIAPFFTIGETYFMREQPVFDALKERILPNLLNQRRKNNHLYIKIWSAGCSSGEEPYSIAILLRETIKDIDDWQISILGTDINPHALQKAKSGIYTEWSFRRIDDNIKQKYFRKIGKKTYEISRDVRSMVVFNELNLADLDFPAVHNSTYQCDIIMCRNVLYYFSESKRNQILNKLSLSLAEGGWLINSPSESYSNLLTNLQAYFFPGSMCYRKINNTKKPEGEEPLIDPYVLSKTSVKQSKTLSITSPKFTNKQSAAFPTKTKKTSITKPKPVSSQPNDSEYTLKQLLQQAKVAADAGNYPEAEKLCQKVLENDPINAAAYYLLGVIQAEQNQLEPAVKQIQKALFLNPDMVLAHFVLGNLFFQLNKTDKARLHFRNATKLLQQFNENTTFDLSDMSAGELKTYLLTIQPSVGA